MDFLGGLFTPILSEFLRGSILAWLRVGQIGFNVEVTEEKDKYDGLNKEVVGDDAGELTLESDQTESIDED